MQKIPSLIRNGQIDPAHDWVLAGKGTATRMWDGLPYAVINNQPYSHLISSKLTQDVIVCGVWNHQFWGWGPVPPEDLRFWQMWTDVYEREHVDWTYEVIGPEINGNPEQAARHVMVPHGRLTIRTVEPTIESLTSYLATEDVEGIVWWEDIWDPGCRKVKVQQADLGLKRKQRRNRNYA
jgi:hypothetical protein